jgi:hypothetical protein
MRRCFVAVVGIVELAIEAFETSAEMVIEVETMTEMVVEGRWLSKRWRWRLRRRVEEV